jgi:hypothetical protein
MNQLPDRQPAQPEVPPAWRKALDNPALMLAMLFLVTAALGLPFLWMSHGFTTFWKVVVSIAVILWTALVLWVFWLIMVWCYVRVRDAVCPAAFLVIASAVAWRAARLIRIPRF